GGLDSILGGSLGRLASGPNPGADPAREIARDTQSRILLAIATAAAGRPEVLKSIKAIRCKSTLSLKAPGEPIEINMDETQVPPDRVYVRVHGPTSEFAVTISPQ